MTREHMKDSEQGDLNWVDRDLNRFFQQFEGDEHPRTRPSRSRVRPFGLAFGAISLVAVATAVVVWTTDGPGGVEPRGTQGACEALIQFRNVLYAGEGLPSKASLRRGRPLGDGTSPACNDTQVPGQPPGGSGSQVVPLVSLEGIESFIAVAPADQEQTIFVAAGRCAGFDAWSARLQCWREPLMFGGRAYTATRLRTDRINVGGAVGSGRVGTKEVIVRRIPSVRETAAVATEPNGSVVYLSHEGCFFSPATRSFEEDLIECLTTGRK
jgi:hypothetical protein